MYVTDLIFGHGYKVQNYVPLTDNVSNNKIGLVMRLEDARAMFRLPDLKYRPFRFTIDYYRGVTVVHEEKYYKVLQPDHNYEIGKDLNKIVSVVLVEINQLEAFASAGKVKDTEND